VLFLGFPYLIGGYSDSTGWIPVFDETYIRSAWYLVVLWTVFGIVREMVKLTERRYSKRLALTTVITHVFTSVSATAFFMNSRIMNPVFLEKAGSMIEGVGVVKISQMLGHVNLIILMIMLFDLLLDIGVTTFRSFRYDK